MDVVKAPDNSREQRLIRLVETYQKPLLDLCYIYLHDRELAKDAVQDTFLKAYRAMKTFRGESKERTWLTRIAINTCRDIKRSAWQRHLNRAVTPEDLPAVGECQPLLSIDIADAVMRLPDPYKEVILLHYFQEMTISEIASMMGVAPSSISRRIKKANKELYSVLGKEYLDGQ